MDIILALPIILAISGLLAALGLGGASVYVPLFVWMGMPIKQAIVAGLGINIASTLVCTWKYRSCGLLKNHDLSKASLIFAGAAIGSVLGVRISHTLPPDALTGLLAATLLLSGIMVAGKLKIAAAFDSDASKFAIGIMVGMISGTLGIGGGIVLVPLMMQQGNTPRKAAAISQAVVLLSSAFGFALHHASADVPVEFIAMAGAAAAVGAAVGAGAVAGNKIGGKAAKAAFSILLLAMGLKLAYDFIAGG